MRITLFSLLAAQRALYDLPRDMKRFDCYSRPATTTATSPSA